MALRRIAVAAGAAALLAACDRPPSSNERGAVRGAPAAPPNTVVDSALPPGEALRRFRVGLDSPAQLDGPTSRALLVQKFFEALRRRDRVALENLALTKAEYAYLVYPDSRWSKPPYNQPPDIDWLLLSADSEGSLTKLLGRAQRFEPIGWDCDRPPEMDGGVRYWPGCVVHVRDEGQPRDLHLFGSIMERNGRFKFRDFRNDF